MRTPLTALSLHLQALFRRLQGTGKGPSREEMQQAVESANRLLSRLAKLISELLEVSRVAAGRLQLTREQVDLLALVRESLLRLERPLADADCRVELQADGTLTGHWDPDRLDQVVDNLISNAAKYGAGKPVVVRLRDLGERVVLEVADRVFERFERAVSRRRFGGFGLGLWIARRVVEAHGGTLTLESELGHGSTFTVNLPR